MKAWTAALVVGVVAGGACAADTVNLSKISGTTNGGAFRAITGQRGTFQTFCVERDEYVHNPSWYDISDAAKFGGLNGGNPDPISDTTRALYFAFRKGWVGIGRAALRRAAAYGNEPIVFDRPIGQNQGVQFPIARSYVNIEAANLMRFEACRRFDAGLDCGAQANMAKLLASEASWEAANACIQTHGGFGFAREYDVERKFREARLYQVAPISTNLILSYVGEHILGMPRSF